MNAAVAGSPARKPEGRRSTTALAGRPCLASIVRSTGDGVGYVSLLLERALGDLFGAVATVDLAPSSPGRVSAGERMRFATRLARAAIGGGAEWVMYSHLGIARSQLLLPAPLRLPYAVFLHGVEIWKPDLDRSRVAALRGAAVRLTNSHYTARRVAALHPQLGELRPCPLGLLPDDGAAPTRPDARAPRTSTYALIVGRMSADERYKGHDELLECWPAVRAAGADARLVVVGGGDDRGRLEAKAASLGVAESVTFAGRVPDGELAALYAGASLFAMPSSGEGFGLVYVHAMRAGLPCIASVDDGASEVVEDGRTGVLVRKSDRRELTEALIGLLSNDERARAMGAAGRARYERLFTFEAFRARLAAVLGVGSEGGRGA